MLTASVRRMLLLTYAPERAWHEAAATATAHPVTRHLGLLALLPAAVAALLASIHGEAIPAAWLTPLASGSPFSLALQDGAAAIGVPVMPIAERASTLVAAQLAAVTYVATWLLIASGAAILNLLLPLFSARRNLHRCMMVASYSATPLLLATVTLLHPSLVAIIALAAMHSCYIAYLGLPTMLGVPRSEAGVCLGITAIASLVFGQVAGYGAGALVSAVIH